MPRDIRASAKPEPKAFTATGGPAVIAAAEGEGDKKKLGTFSGRAYTGVPMRPQGWYTPVIIDLDGVRAKQNRPALRQHDHEQIVGHTTKVKVATGADGGIDVEGLFSGQDEHVAKVVEPAQKGFQWQYSVGANPVRTEYLETGEETEVNGRTWSGPLVISRETELGEVSFVPLGADDNTSAVVSASQRKGSPMFRFRKMLKAARLDNPVLAAKYSDEDVDKMDEKEAKAALKECMKGDGDEDDDEDKKKKKAEAEDDKKAEARVAKGIEAATQKGIEAARKAQADEHVRISDIRARVARHGVTTVEIESDGKKGKVDLVAHAIAAGWSPDTAELHALRSARPGAGVGGPHLHFPTRPEVSDAVIECAVFQAAQHEFRLFDDDFYAGTAERGPLPARYKRQLQGDLKARYTDQVQQAAHTNFKGRIGLQQMLTRLAAANGYTGSEVIRDDGDLAMVAHHAMIRADGASTASIANVLANVQNKMLGQGYLYVERAWAEVAAIRSVKDFKATKAINLFGDFEYKDLGTSGELKNATLQDQAFANQASTSGRILTISRQHIINDDLAALTTVPILLGRGAGLKINKAFWTLFLNPGNDEGASTAFWAATHTIANQQAKSNYISGGSSALQSTALQLAKQTFDKQVDPMGNPLGVEAKILLYPTELDQKAWELLNSSFVVAGGGSSADRQPSSNRWTGKYRPVMSRYLSNDGYTGYSTTAWWLLADPAEVPVIEVVFLNGQEMPTVQTAGPEFQFNTLGISMRAILDSGVAMQNFRGGVKSAGA